MGSKRNSDLVLSSLSNACMPWAYVRDMQTSSQGSYQRHINPERDPQVLKQLNRALREGYVHTWYEMLSKHPCTVSELGKIKTVTCVGRYCLLLDNYMEVFLKTNGRTYDGVVEEMTAAEIAAREAYGLLGGKQLLRRGTNDRVLRTQYIGILGAYYAR